MNEPIKMIEKRIKYWRKNYKVDKESGYLAQANYDLAFIRELENVLTYIQIYAREKP